MLGLDTEQTASSRSSPKPQLKPQLVQKKWTNVVVIDVPRPASYAGCRADQTRQRRVGRPAAAVDVDAVTRLVRPRYTLLRHGVGLIRRVSVVRQPAATVDVGCRRDPPGPCGAAQRCPPDDASASSATACGVRCRIHRDRLVQPTR
ncbi:hypothetical protein ACLB1R_04310 [Escherichia coli]